MKTHRGLIIALTVVAVLACVPAVAQASSLLSGYGGPGQGSQALLGATLVGGPSGGGGASSSGGAVSGQSPSGNANSGSGAHRARGGRGEHGSAQATGRAGVDVQRRPAAPRVADTGAGSSTLGLSAADLVYIMAVLGGLVLIAVLTRGLARSARQGSPD